jgi:hypothetical protein
VGEYWKPINVTKREYLHPHDFDCGMKLCEWSCPGSPVMSAMGQLMASGRWSSDDLIVFGSDYRRYLAHSGSGDVPNNVYELADDEFLNISGICDGTGAKEALRRDALTETIAWIPVSERLPETPHQCVGVLVVINGHIDQAVYFASGRWWLIGSDKPLPMSDEITHWAEMPKGPR